MTWTEVTVGTWLSVASSVDDGAQYVIRFERSADERQDLYRCACLPSAAWTCVQPNLAAAKIACAQHAERVSRNEWYVPGWEVPSQSLKHMCPACGVMTNGRAHGNCDMVLGRRGWRQLGVYDG